MSSAPSDGGEMAVHPPEAFLQPWTLRRLRRIADRREDVNTLLKRWRDQRRIETVLDPVIDVHLAETVAFWAQDMAECEPHLPADAVRALVDEALHAGYFLGRLLVGTADSSQVWSDEPDHAEVLAWMDQVVDMIDWSDVGQLVGTDTDTAIAHATTAALDDIVRRCGMHGEHEAPGRASACFDNGLCVALVEHSATRPVAEHIWVNLTVIGDVLPPDPRQRLHIAEALGCLLTRVDDRGRCSEADLRDAADELGGERGHRYFRQLRKWGVVDYKLTRRNTGTVDVPRHRELVTAPLDT